MSQFHYEIGININGSDEIIDLNYCSFIRIPILKTTSFCIIKCCIPQVLIQEMIEMCSDNEYPEVKLTIYLIDELSTYHDKRVNTIYDRTLKCLSIKSDETLNMENNSNHATMILSHPILHYMGTTNTYNEILENTTTYNSLKSFEGWATENHGDLFDFQHFAHSEGRNEYQYEEILVKISNDLAVPSYLIDTYKMNDSLGFYFFDDFNISDKTKNEIIGLYINIEKLATQDGVKTDEYPDTYFLTKILSESPISDVFKKFDKQDHSIVYTNYEMKVNHKKEPMKATIPKKKSSTKSINMLDGRKVNISKNQGIMNKEIKTKTTISNIYTPDDFAGALRRYNKCKDVLKNKIRRFVNIEITNSFPDYPNFGKKYDIEKSGKYNYTPLNIINTFVRKTSKENFCSLITWCTMINFKE